MGTEKKDEFNRLQKRPIALCIWSVIIDFLSFLLFSTLVAKPECEICTQISCSKAYRTVQPCIMQISCKGYEVGETFAVSKEYCMYFESYMYNRWLSMQFYFPLLLSLTVPLQNSHQGLHPLKFRILSLISFEEG